jgi:hypothetical protein
MDSRLTYHGQARPIVTINFKKIVLVFYVFVVIYTIPKLLNIPYFYEITINTRNVGVHNLSYSITFVDIPIIIIGLLLYKRSKVIKFLPILIYLIIKNVIRYELGVSNVISLGSYEMFLSIIVAFAAAVIICKIYNDHEQLERVMDWIIWINFVTQCLYILIGRGTISSGVGCLAQDSGSMGFFCATYIIILLFVRKNISRKRFLICLIVAMLSLFFSGSRTHFILSIVFIIVFWFKSRTELSNNAFRRRFTLVSIVVSCMTLFFIFISGSLDVTILNRLQTLLSGKILDNLFIDASFSERLTSIIIGIDVLKENVCGISNSFVDLMNHMIERGSTTFPHSYLLSYYLLWGLPAGLCYLFYVKCAVKAIKHNHAILIVVIYMLLIYLIYGAPSVSVKVLFWHFLLATYIKLCLLHFKKHDKKNKIKLYERP